jgi:hypothetical protein
MEFEKIIVCRIIMSLYLNNYISVNVYVAKVGGTLKYALVVWCLDLECVWIPYIYNSLIKTLDV